MADFTADLTAAGPETPTQRTRAFAQGVTFGFADEIEAAIRSTLSPREYDDLVAETRTALAEYQQARPAEAFAAELSGAALPAIIGSLFTAGAAGAGTLASLASKFPTMAKVIGVAAPKSLVGAATVAGAQGALTGIGKGEDVSERLTGGVIGAGIGAAGGAGMYAAAEPIKRAAVGVVDFARRKLGGRGAKVVETELQRLAAESGMSVDEIVEGVASGRIMAENKTLLDAVRGYRATGGRAAGELRQALEPRPEQGRQQAMAEMQRYLSSVDDPNILRGMKATDEEAKIAEAAAYAPFKAQPAPENVTSELAEALRRVPSAAKEIEEALLASTGQKPFFSVSKDNEVSFARQPSLSEAESVRRALSNTATARYQASQGVAGEAISGVERGLRGELDVSAPELAATRAQASITKSARDAFRDGQKALAKSPDAVAVEFAEMMAKGDAVMKAYRSGVMQAIRNRMSGGSRKSMMGALADPQRKESQILSIVMPEDALPDIMARIERAAGSQTAATEILHGPQTAITREQVARQGRDIGAGEVVEALTSPNVMNLMRLGGKLVQRAAPQLTDAQRQQVVRVLVSESPDVVRNALQDEGKMMAFQRRLDLILGAAQAGVQRAAPVMAPQLIEQMTQTR